MITPGFTAQMSTFLLQSEIDAKIRDGDKAQFDFVQLIRLYNSKYIDPIQCSRLATNVSLVYVYVSDLHTANVINA